MARNNSQPIASPAVTFTPEALKAVIAAAIAEHEAQKAQQAKSDTSTDMEKATIAAFKRKGFTDIQPRVNTLTYGKWVEAGRKVKEGETAVKVKNLRLFHVSQTQPISAAEQTEYLAKRAAKTADKLPKVSPVEPPKAPPAPKPLRKSAKVLITEPGNA